MMHTGWPADTVGGMQAIRRLVSDDPGIIAGAGSGIGIADAGIGITAAGLVAVAAWGSPRLIGSEAIAGPSWLLALLPLLVGAALALRRRTPLAMWLAIWAGVALLCLLAHNSLRGLAFTFVLLAAAYSLGAHASFRRAVAGLLLTVPVVVVLGYAGELGLAFGKGREPGAALALLQLAAFWLAGVLVHARGQAAALAARNATLQRQAEQAVAAERTRIARELHDIVAHHLSVIVLQAAGTRASGKPAEATLEKIENSARQALTETRRLLGVLRDPDDEAGLGPQPGIGDLDELAASVRAAGLPVHLVIDGDPAALPAAVDVSVYRIVQEALTNVGRHAAGARATVHLHYAPDTFSVQVDDDGTANGTGGGLRPAGTGLGLIGMRERASALGGRLRAGPRDGGGFQVRADFPARPPS
jgi:signal transduction histidine kinase